MISSKWDYIMAGVNGATAAWTALFGLKVWVVFFVLSALAYVVGTVKDKNK